MSSSRVMAVAADRCVWMYAVADDGTPGPAGAVTGVGGGVVRAVRAAGLTALVSDVSAVECGETALRRNLEDLDWLERTARAHHGVIEAAAECGPVVPMQLATVYTSDAAVAATLAERGADLRDALRRASARSEWGVKAYLAGSGAPDRPDGPVADGPPARPAAAPAPGAGAAYLRRRRAQLTAQQDARQAALSSAQAVHDRLGQLAAAARLYPPQSPELTGQAERMILNAAYLVADERAGEFAAAVEDLAAQHPSIRLVRTGPWPPYSFVANPEAAGEDPRAAAGEAEGQP